MLKYDFMKYRHCLLKKTMVYLEIAPLSIETYLSYKDVFKYRNKIGKIVVKAVPYSVT